MKSLCAVLVLILTVAFSVSCSAQISGSVLCQGTICGGIGMRMYQYQVSMTGALLNHWHLGTCDPNPANYTNILMPAGWTFGIFNFGDAHDGYTPHGGTSLPQGSCQWSIVWTGPGVQSATFGFDNPNLPHDVGWALNQGIVTENWAMPVGLGAGPIHAPAVAEPGTLFVLGYGLIKFAGASIRRRGK